MMHTVVTRLREGPAAAKGKARLTCSSIRLQTKSHKFKLVIVLLWRGMYAHAIIFR